MGSSSKKLVVVMFPWLAYGHVAPFLELGKRLCQMNFEIHICSTPANLNSIKNKIPTGDYNNNSKIQLVELHLPTLPSLPPKNHTTNGLPPHLESTLRKALRMAKPDFLNILSTIKPDLLIYDFLVPWVGATAVSQFNIPTASFLIISTVSYALLMHVKVHPDVDFPFPEIRLTEYEHSMACKTVEHAFDDILEDELPPDDRIFLMNTTRELEGKYVDYVKSQNVNIVPVGALVQETRSVEVRDLEDNSELMGWLKSKSKFSTVFVSFGTECYLTKADIEEVSFGLEHSGANFIWVIRFPKGDNHNDVGINDALPEGFVERVGERGKVIEGWAPQAKILMHPNVGGFVTHCGWNSIIETIEFGVPIIAMPMRLDQPTNAKLMVDLGIGVEVLRDDKGNLQRCNISKVINDVVFGTKTGEILRKRVVEKRERIRLMRIREIEDVGEKLALLCVKDLSQA